MPVSGADAGTERVTAAKPTPPAKSRVARRVCYDFPATHSHQEASMTPPIGLQLYTLREELGSSYTHEDRPRGTRQRTGIWPLAYKERIGWRRVPERPAQPTTSTTP